VTISSRIARGDFDSLKGLVHEPSIAIIKENFNKLNENQKKNIAIPPEDIQYNLHYYFDLAKAESSSFVVIGMLIYCVPGIAAEMAKLGSNRLDPFEITRKYKEELMICDYRYI
jgi:hypothetical protein